MSVYRLMNLTKHRRYKRRLPSRDKKALTIPENANLTWSMDFMSDSLANGRKFRVFNVIDDYNREALINEAYYSIPSQRVTQILSELLAERGCPNCADGLQEDFTSTSTMMKNSFISTGKWSQESSSKFPSENWTFNSQTPENIY